MIYWLVVYFFKSLFFIFHRHKVKGLENIPEGAAIIAPNHVSHYDPPVVAISSPFEVYFLARESLFKVPLLGPLMRYLNAYPVKGTSKDMASFKLLTKLLKEGKKVCIFAEGARSWDGNLLPMQLGVGMIAMRSNCPIVPTYIQGTFEVYPRFRSFPKFWGKTTCRFGKPIDPKDYAHLDKKEAQIAITKELAQAIERLSRS